MLEATQLPQFLRDGPAQGVVFEVQSCEGTQVPQCVRNRPGQIIAGEVQLEDVAINIRGDAVPVPISRLPVRVGRSTILSVRRIVQRLQRRPVGAGRHGRPHAQRQRQQAQPEQPPRGARQP